MKTYILLISLFFISILSVHSSYAQQQDTLKQKQIKYYSRVLSTGQDTAMQVVAIMDTYKEGVKKVVADATLAESARRGRIDDLIAEKNRKLSLLLSLSQQVKVIPTTERKK